MNRHDEILELYFNPKVKSMTNTLSEGEYDTCDEIREQLVAEYLVEMR